MKMKCVVVVFVEGGISRISIWRGNGKRNACKIVHCKLRAKVEVEFNFSSFHFMFLICALTCSSGTLVTDKLSQ